MSDSQEKSSSGNARAGEASPGHQHQHKRVGPVVTLPVVVSIVALLVSAFSGYSAWGSRVIAERQADLSAEQADISNVSEELRALSSVSVALTDSDVVIENRSPFPLLDSVVRAQGVGFSTTAGNTFSQSGLKIAMIGTCQRLTVSREEWVASASSRDTFDVVDGHLVASSVRDLEPALERLAVAFHLFPGRWWSVYPNGTLQSISLGQTAVGVRGGTGHERAFAPEEVLGDQELIAAAILAIPEDDTLGDTVLEGVDHGDVFVLGSEVVAYPEARIAGYTTADYAALHPRWEAIEGCTT